MDVNYFMLNAGRVELKIVNSMVYKMSKEREENIERLISSLHPSYTLSDEEILDTLSIIDNIVSVVNQKVTESNPSDESEVNETMSMLSIISTLKDLYLYIIAENIFVTKK